MSGNDKKEKALNEKEELLKEALDACMEEQLSFIPPECEIVRMHIFSEEFQEYMEKLLKTKGRSKQRTMASHEFIYSFNKVAASILVLLVIGGLLAGGTMLLSSSSKSSTTDMAASSEINESAAAEEPAATPEEEYGEYEEAASGAGESQEAPAGDAGETGGTSAQRSVEFMGGRIFLADNQRLREKTETVKTLVNSPVIARDAVSIKVTIGNMDERPIYYYGAMDLEVLIDGAWYLVPPKEELTEEEDNRIVRLEPGMAQDEEIFLENYEWDYDAEQYRVVTYLDDMILCSKFRFENPEEDLEEALEQTWD